MRNQNDRPWSRGELSDVLSCESLVRVSHCRPATPVGSPLGSETSFLKLMCIIVALTKKVSEKKVKKAEVKWSSMERNVKLGIEESIGMIRQRSPGCTHLMEDRDYVASRVPTGRLSFQAKKFANPKAQSREIFWGRAVFHCTKKFDFSFHFYILETNFAVETFFRRKQRYPLYVLTFLSRWWCYFSDQVDWVVRISEWRLFDGSGRQITMDSVYDFGNARVHKNRPDPLKLLLRCKCEKCTYRHFSYSLSKSVVFRQLTAVYFHCFLCS